jgi:hypothetical protein
VLGDVLAVHKRAVGAAGIAQSVTAIAQAIDPGMDARDGWMVEQHRAALPAERDASLFRIQVMTLELGRLLGSLEQRFLYVRGTTALLPA